MSASVLVWTWMTNRWHGINSRSLSTENMVKLLFLKNCVHIFRVLLKFFLCLCYSMTNCALSHKLRSAYRYYQHTYCTRWRKNSETNFFKCSTFQSIYCFSLIFCYVSFSKGIRAKEIYWAHLETWTSEQMKILFI